ncbi:hypothetical protein NQ318_009650 [Aromia moschata]|uniref:Uncharacterized protein n=1 Tax=Aromia moschata TaxID=1265417 RepID=A0AAV8Y026_9CUCU|nr:hypothetical protein NQ318_009650 [Aromia moschata]
MAGLFNTAYMRVASMEEGVSSFKATEMFPMNPEVFCDDDFIATDEEVPACMGHIYNKKKTHREKLDGPNS